MYNHKWSGMLTIKKLKDSSFNYNVFVALKLQTGLKLTQKLQKNNVDLWISIQQAAAASKSELASSDLIVKYANHN